MLRLTLVAVIAAIMAAAYFLLTPNSDSPVSSSTANKPASTSTTTSASNTSNPTSKGTALSTQPQVSQPAVTAEVSVPSTSAAVVEEVIESSSPTAVIKESNATETAVVEEAQSTRNTTNNESLASNSQPAAQTARVKAATEESVEPQQAVADVTEVELVQASKSAASNSSQNNTAAAQDTPPKEAAEKAEPVAVEDKTATVQPSLQQAAKAHVAQITSKPEQAVDITAASHFVTEQQLLEIPAVKEVLEQALVPVTPEPNSQSQIAATAEPVEASANSFAVSVGGFKPKVSASDEVAYGVKSQAQNPVLTTVTAPLQATKSQLVVNPATNPVAVEATSNTAEISDSAPASGTQSQQIQLKELLSETQANEKRIFYIHSVTEGDEQGLWGILQRGITDTFAKGIELPVSGSTVTAQIPEDADELLSNKQSSFLGKLLSNKSQSTYVYNYQQGYIGDNPNYIKPGQQLIIVTFTEQELMSVYRHFTEESVQ